MENERSYDEILPFEISHQGAACAPIHSDVAYRRKASLGGVQEAALWAAATAPIALRLCLVRSICAQSRNRGSARRDVGHQRDVLPRYLD